MAKGVKTMRLRRVVCYFCLSLLSVIIFSGCEASNVVFSSKGMSITLTEDFVENKEYYGMVYYDSEEAQVYVAKEEFSVLEEKGEKTDFNLEEYANFLLKSISVTAEIKNDEGLVYFEYSKKPENISYNYFVTVHKTDDAFWFFQFSCESSLIGEYRPLFKTWAKTIVFD